MVLHLIGNFRGIAIIQIRPETILLIYTGIGDKYADMSDIQKIGYYSAGSSIVHNTFNGGGYCHFGKFYQ